MRLCGYEIKAGEKKAVRFPVPGGGDLEATLICGEKAGKTLVAAAGVHGCEYNGIEALRRLSKELDPGRLSGQVILLPLVNPHGFYAGARQVVPSDGVNLNRAFPGKGDGTESERLAAVIEEVFYPEADLLVDLHGGDVNEMAMAFVYFPAVASAEVSRISREAAQTLSLPYRVASSARNGLYSWAAQQGVPALLLERGGCGTWSEEEIGGYGRNICELLAYLGILPPAFPAFPQQQIEQAVYLEARERGFWYPKVREGQTFPQGAVLGELRNYKGELIQRWEAEFAGVTLYYTLALGVQKGDPLLAYGKL